MVGLKTLLPFVAIVAPFRMLPLLGLPVMLLLSNSTNAPLSATVP